MDRARALTSLRLMKGPRFSLAILLRLIRQSAGNSLRNANVQKLYLMKLSAPCDYIVSLSMGKQSLFLT